MIDARRGIFNEGTQSLVKYSPPNLAAIMKGQGQGVRRDKEFDSIAWGGCGPYPLTYCWDKELDSDRTTGGVWMILTPDPT